MKDSLQPWLIGAYLVGDAATFIYLLVEDFHTFNWWNWLLIVPLDVILAQMWPIYWLILRPIFGN